MKRGPVILLGLLFAAGLAGGGYAMWSRRTPDAMASKATQNALSRAPAGVRVKVEVVNTTRIRGLGRRATQFLRDQGFDVVAFSTGGPLRDTTLVLDRSHHPAWSATVVSILGPTARVESRPDSSRYLDITVLLGSAWRPPAEPLNP